MRRSDGNQVRAVGMVLPLLALALAGCPVGGIDPFEFAVVVNATGHEIVVFLDYPAGETDFMELTPGESDTTDFSDRSGGCAPATLIARDSSGREVDRIGQEFCVGDRWEIRDR